MKLKKLLIPALVGAATIAPIVTMVGCGHSGFRVVNKTALVKKNTSSFIDHILCQLYLEIIDWKQDWEKTKVTFEEQEVDGWTIMPSREKADKQVEVGLMYDINSSTLPDPLPKFDGKFHVELVSTEDSSLKTKYVFALKMTFKKTQAFSVDYDIPLEFKTFHLALESKE